MGLKGFITWLFTDSIWLTSSWAVRGTQSSDSGAGGVFASCISLISWRNSSMSSSVTKKEVVEASLLVPDNWTRSSVVGFCKKVKVQIPYPVQILIPYTHHHCLDKSLQLPLNWSLWIWSWRHPVCPPPHTHRVIFLKWKHFLCTSYLLAEVGI